MTSPFSTNDYTIGFICVLLFKRTAIKLMLDGEHDLSPATRRDNNIYPFSSIRQHKVVLASLGARDYKTGSASGVENDIRQPS